VSRSADLKKVLDSQKPGAIVTLRVLSVAGSPSVRGVERVQRRDAP
jgi:hypothetical protein